MYVCILHTYTTNHETQLLDNPKMETPVAKALASPQRDPGQSPQTLHSQELPELRPRRQTLSLDAELYSQRTPPLPLCSCGAGADDAPSSPKWPKTAGNPLSSRTGPHQRVPPPAPKIYPTAALKKLVALDWQSAVSQNGILRRKQHDYILRDEPRRPILVEPTFLISIVTARFTSNSCSLKVRFALQVAATLPLLIGYGPLPEISMVINLSLSHLRRHIEYGACRNWTTQGYCGAT